MKIGTVILSGGYSSRMDGFKPLMKLGKKHLLEHVVELFRGAGVDKIVAVTGHKKGEVKAEAERLGIKSTHNKDYDSGMFSSVCAGAKQMKQVDAFFVLPVDIPLIRPSTVSTLIKQKCEKYVVYPTFLGERGHPPLIPAKLIAPILQYNGKGGLKGLLEQHSSLDVPVWDEGILLDADTPKDFSVLKKRLSQMDMGSRAEVKALSQLAMRKRGQDHGMAVADIACKIGKAMNKKGYSLDMELLYNSALLHDIAKGKSHHEEKGAELLTELGLNRLADIVEAHRDATLPKSGRLTEKELVCLADKVVRGTNRMPVQSRFGEKLQIYAKDTEACNAIKKRLARAKELETVVVDCIGCSLEKLLDIGKRR
ncbi:DVU_1551 family NTP transferase [Desulforhopalus sp. 52FAK]